MCIRFERFVFFQDENTHAMPSRLQSCEPVGAKLLRGIPHVVHSIRMRATGCLALVLSTTYPFFLMSLPIYRPTFIRKPRFFLLVTFKTILSRPLARSKHAGSFFATILNDQSFPPRPFLFPSISSIRPLAGGVRRFCQKRASSPSPRRHRMFAPTDRPTPCWHGYA